MDRELVNLKNELENIFANQKFLNEICSVVTDGFSINYKGKIIYCNEKYAEIFGYKKEELVGKDVLNLCSEKEKEFWKKILEEDKEGEFETKCIKRDGSEIFVKVRVKNLEYEGKILRIASVKDITEDKISFIKIKESEEKYKVLTDTLLDGIIIIDRNGKILFSNSVGANLFGYERVEDFKGQNIFDFILEPEKFEKNLQLIYKNKSGYFIEHEIKDKKGVRFFIETIGKKIKFMGEDGILLCFRDVTERRIIIENLKEAIGNTKKILNQTVLVLSDLFTFRDPYTSKHQKRVAKLAVEIGKEIGFSGSLIEGIRIVSLLHDIGKIFIPTDILAKPGELSKIEWDFIKMHPEYGANIVKSIEFPWDVSKIILQHHERLNGSGYPYGLKENEILFETKVLSVADVVEAMSSHRPYREKHSIEETLDEIKKNSDILYDREVVNATLRVFKKGFKFEEP